MDGRLDDGAAALSMTFSRVLMSVGARAISGSARRKQGQLANVRATHKVSYCADDTMFGQQEFAIDHHACSH